jgi:Ca2+-binding RTX toxin-like protein
MPTQTTYVYNQNAFGLQFTMSETWTIATGVFVGSHDTNGVVSTYDASRLINEGHVYSAESYGVRFTGNDSSVVNRASGSIFGTYGVVMDGHSNTAVTNHGSIVGYTWYGVLVNDASHFALTNDGEIDGHYEGVYLYSGVSGLTGATIDNAGLIHSDGSGIFVQTATGETTTIVNEPGGTIKGIDSSVRTDSGNLLLENHGTLRGRVLSANAASIDKVFNDGAIKGEVHLGPGDDVFRNQGGNAGKVFGGDGNDKLFAGPHADKFVFDTTLDAAANVDRVHHFDPGTDRMFLDQTVFTNLTGPGTLTSGEFHKGDRAAASDDRIVYNPDTGALYYDPDGTGSTHKVQFAQLDKGLHLHHDDFTVIA